VLPAADVVADADAVAVAGQEHVKGASVPSVPSKRDIKRQS